MCYTYLKILFLKNTVFNGKLSPHTRFNSPSSQNEIIALPLPGLDVAIDDDVCDRKTNRYLILFNTGVDFFLINSLDINMDGHNFDGLTNIYASCWSNAQGHLYVSTHRVQNVMLSQFLCSSPPSVVRGKRPQSFGN